MRPHILLTSLLIILLPSPIQACIIYRATFPFSNKLPFEATIIDHGVTTCWISETYEKHNKMQILANLNPTLEELAHPDLITWGFKRWDFDCLPGRYAAWANVGVRSTGYLRKVLAEEVGVVTGNGQKGKKEGDWETISWVNGVWEDVEGEKWVYEKKLGCDSGTNSGGDGKHGKKMEKNGG